MNGGGAKKKVYVPKGPTDKQIEARTPDGKRRITPIFIPPENEDTYVTSCRPSSLVQQLHTNNKALFITFTKGAGNFAKLPVIL